MSVIQTDLQNARKRLEADKGRIIGERIRKLRGRRPQRLIAANVGVTKRAYQTWEAGGGISWENLEKLAECFGVSTDYLEHGGEAAAPTIDLTALGRIEAKIDRLLAPQ